MARSKDKSSDDKSTYGQAVLPLPEMTVSSMELSYPNDHLEDHKGDGNVTRTNNSLELTKHESIPTGSTPVKTTPRDHSDSFDNEGPSIKPKADKKEKEPVVDIKQDSVHGSPKCYNGYSQLVQLKQPPHHRDEAGTGVAYSSTPQSQDLLIDTSPQCLTLHTSLNLRERIVAILARQKNARHTEDGT